ncbi:tetratricopeptide repeat protein [Mucilaginibacter sp.]|uniref:tetratricopeptide repeat protein n=1 Tax=Mucilaginibacter sp. TaxID=1882438 RepID=UPI00284BE5F5|nr:tetratricopeptide repeat protein [Mucilaginibacter sp.]MDR3694870.1 hypothetical protein [Mucilaginibacter sp.]
MKSLYISLIIICFIPAVYGQQGNKADDALLLEYYQNQRFADAADYLKKTYAEPVTDLKILSSLAYSSQMAGRLPDAEGYYERIYMADTTNTSVLFSLGNIMVRRGNNIKALFYYKKILLKDSTNFSVYKQMGSMAINAGNLAEATKYYEKANKINPAEPDVAYDLSSFYINAKLFQKADTIVSKALKADTANLLLLLSKAQVDYHLEKYPETVLECTRLINYGQRQNLVINSLGTSYYKLKDYNNCINTFKLLEETNTATEISYYCTAMSYKALGDQHKAISYFEKAIKEAISNNVNSYYSEMADSYSQVHQVKNAVGAYQKSLLYGAMPLTYYDIASLYDVQLKKKEMALQYYKKYVKSDPPEEQKPYLTYSKRRIGELSR